MRHVIFKDIKISTEDFTKWRTEDEIFWKEYTGVSPYYWVIEHDFSDYPVEPDLDGDMRLTKVFMKTMTDKIYTSYGKDGTDFVMLLVHRDNWKSIPVGKKGIWGINQSNVYYNYHVQYCRWDNKNLANTFGTLYHERHHALDALIATELGIDVRDLLAVNSWDTDVTHGASAEWDYIRWKENTKSLTIIAPHLRAALAKRQARHDEFIKGQKLTVIGLLEKLVYLYRQKLYKKDGLKK